MTQATTRQLKTAGITCLFDPRSIAMVGVSTRPGSVGRQALRTLRKVGFSGTVAIVHPREAEIDGVPCFAELTAIPDPPDLVMIFTAALDVPRVLEQAAVAGARSAIVFSAGFGESGGTDLDRNVRAIVERTGIRVLGPNCQGVINLPGGVAATFTNALSAPDLGAAVPIAYLGQSGAVGGSVFDLLRERGLTPAVWASAGNQLDVDVTELAEHVVEQRLAEFIVIYVEQMPAADRWIELCRRAREVGIRLAVLRTGMSEAGRLAVASHTGSLVPAGKAFGLVCAAYDVVTLADIDDAVALASAWNSRPAGPRLGVVTTSGGAGGLAADLADAHGLSIGALSTDTRAQLASLLPGFAAVGNPVDVTAQLLLTNPDAFREVCRAVAQDPGIDHLVVIMTVVVGTIAERFATAVQQLKEQDGISASVVYIASHDRTQTIRATLARSGIAVYDALATMAKAIAAVAPRTGVSPPVDEPPTDAADSSAAESAIWVQTEWEGQELLHRFGIPQPESHLARTPEESAELATRLGGDVVLKVQSPHLLHKSDAGAIRVGVAAADAAAAHREIVAAAEQHHPGLQIDGVLVQRRAPAGVELLVGVQGPSNGYPPVLSVAAGGVAVEIYADVASALAPLDESRAMDLLRELKSWPLLSGHRGRPGVAAGAAARAIARIGDLALSYGDDLVDVEVNPLIVHADGAEAVDFVARTRGVDG